MKKTIRQAEKAVDNYQGHLLDSRYLVEDLIGRGGMGVVYRGRHVVVGRSVAIKFLSTEFTMQEDVVKRFYREAQTAAAIGHKNIVDILDVGISEHNEPYFVMEYLEGESLSEMIARNGPLSLSAALGILEPILLAMSSAHAKGIVHRDLKPENVFLVRDPVDNSVLVKLIDFGISKFLHLPENDKLTRAGSALGTPCYMSPEQISSSYEVDHRADIYAIGVLFFEMLVGDTPHSGGGNQETMIKILTEPPRDPAELNPNFPEAARAVIERAMAVNPAERYQSAAEMLIDARHLEGFSARLEALAAAALTNSGRYAVGDLGRKIGDDENSEVPGRVWSSLAAECTSGIRTSKSPFSILEKYGTKGGVMLSVGLLAAVVLAIALIWSMHDAEPRGDAATVPLVAAAAVQPKESAPPPPVIPETRREVRIEIVGAPARSTITFDGVLVPSTRFYIPIGETAARLTVEAPGFLPFETDVVPSEDAKIEVEMRPEPVSARAGKNRKPYVKGRRQTEIVTDFE